MFPFDRELAAAQREVQQRFHERQGELSRREVALEDSSTATGRAIHSLTSAKTDLDLFLEAQQLPMKTTQDCIAIRSRRINEDVVRDQVQKI